MSHCQVFGIVLDTEGLDAAEHFGECLHLCQDVSSFYFELLDLAAPVNVFGVREARLDYEDSSRSDLCQLVCFKAVVVEAVVVEAVVVEVCCSFKISISNQYQGKMSLILSPVADRYI